MDAYAGALSGFTGLLGSTTFGGVVGVGNSTVVGQQTIKEIGGRSKPARGGGLLELSPKERAALFFERKKERLLELGLLPPPDSPFMHQDGRVAANPALLEMEEVWIRDEPIIMEAAREFVEGREGTDGGTEGDGGTDGDAAVPPRASVFRPPPEVVVVKAEEGLLPVEMMMGLGGMPQMNPNAVFANMDPAVFNTMMQIQFPPQFPPMQ